MTYIIRVSNGWHDTFHGPWFKQDTADRTAERWNRMFARRGWNLGASVHALLGKDAATRDLLGRALVDLGHAHTETMAAGGLADPCPCQALDVDPGSVGDDTPDGVCACGHVPDEHEADGVCGSLLVLADA